LIFAHAYGKPAVWIELSDKVVGNGFKFYDYYLSLGVQPDEVKRIRINGLSNPFEIAKTAEWFDQKLLREIMEESIFEARKILIP
jgi:pyruvyltransferase